MIDVTLVPAPPVGWVAPTKQSPPLYVMPTVSNPLAQDPTAINVTVPKNTTIPDATNTPFDPTIQLGQMECW